MKQISEVKFGAVMWN